MAGKNERQRRIAREKHRRQQEQRTGQAAADPQARAHRASAWCSGAALIASLLVVFLPGGSAKHPAASASKSPSASPRHSATTVAEPAHHCTYTAATPAAQKVSLPPATPDYTASYQATINTNLGKITFNLLNSKATCTVNSFVHLAEAGYFNNTQCHRLVTSGIYVLQCGDPYATATTKLTCSTTSKIGTGHAGLRFRQREPHRRQIPGRHGGDGQRRHRDQQRQPVLHRVQGQHVRANGLSYTPFATVSSGLGIVQNVAKDGYSCQYTCRASPSGGAPKEKVIIDSVTIKKT